MKDYTLFPPYRYFIRALKNAPKAAFLYVQLWEKIGENISLYTNKKHVRKEYLISPTVFRNLLSDLMFMNLIKFIENENEFCINLMGRNCD